MSAGIGIVKLNVKQTRYYAIKLICISFSKVIFCTWIKESLTGCQEEVYYLFDSCMLK